ncbi:MAG: PilZ domain-containing protein [Desulfomonile tiedjei]|nr:PilZ domain-containing protein [Desulfomonile tiedjei]
MKNTRKINGKEFVGDLRAGFSPHELMEKYELSGDDLRKILRMVLDASAMKKTEIESLPSLYEGTNGQAGIRRFQRKRLDYTMYVYDSVDQLDGGEVMDVSEQGMQIKGLRIAKGEERTFIARSKARSQHRPFVFEAICCWVEKPDGDPKNWLAGLKITRISHLDAKELGERLL